MNHAGVNCRGPLICGFFFNKYRRSFVSLGFASIDSTPKTAFSHSPVRIPCHGLKILFSVHSWLNLRTQSAECKVFEESKVTRGFLTAQGLVPLTPHSSRVNCTVPTECFSLLHHCKVEQSSVEPS